MRLKTITARLAFLSSRYFAIRTETAHGVGTPVETVAAPRHSRVRLRLDKHAFRTQPLAAISSRFRSGHNQTSIPAARRIARLTATRASWILNLLRLSALAC